MNCDPEITLFSLLFFEPGAIDQAASRIKAEDFPQDDHRHTFAAMLELAQNGKPIDPVHVAAKLQDRGYSEAEANEVIDRLTDGSPLPGNILSYVSLVRASSRRRRVAALTAAAIARIEANVALEEVIRELQEGLWVLQSDSSEGGPVAARDFVPTFLEQAAAERTQAGELEGISTGVPDLDAATTGFRPGEFVVVGALPGKGKTAYGMQVAVKAAGQGVPVLVFSLEMSRVEIVRRVLGNRFGAALVRKLRMVSVANWNTMLEHAGDIAALPLYVDDASSLTAADLAARGRAAIRERGVKLIVVDYLQLLRGPEREIRERVGNAANVLRQLAKDTRVPVLALSQLRRPVNMKEKPTMLDLKESGDIEAHAHLVLLLYHPLGSDAKPTGEDEIIMGKSRNGPVGSVPVVFDTRYLVFGPRSFAKK